MLKDSLTIKSIGLMKKGLDTAGLRHDVISNNIANINTPGFKRSSVLFSEELSKASNRGLEAKLLDPKHIPFKGGSNKAQSKVVIENDTIYRNDLNNVDLNQEMADLEKNTLYYNAIAQRMGSGFRLLNSVIQGGGK
ncbi:MAG: flagellar basal body rod protein FlgB [Candidatus Desantisbacteria bacterium]